MFHVYNFKLLSYPRPVIKIKPELSMTSVAGFITPQKYVLFTKTRYTLAPTVVTDVGNYGIRRSSHNIKNK
jgi:hypothetical protein